MSTSSTTDPAPPAPAGPQSTEPRAPRPGARELLVRFLTLREGSIIVVTLLAILYFSLANENFFTHANFINILPYFAPFAILAAGEVLLMVAGEIDLSIGSVYLFAPFMFYQFNEAGLPLVPCLILALLCAAVVGVINGVFVEIIGVSSFITTLGMLLGLGGLTLIISDAQPVAMPGAEVTTRTVDVTHIVNGREDRPAREGQRGRDVREDLRRRRLLRADLGARDHPRRAGPPHDDALGDLHDRGRRQPPGRAGGGHQRPPRP